MKIDQGWTAVATSEYIRGDKPVAIVAHTIELVLYRDQNDVVRVLEDRCAHRRVPLSLGKVCDGFIRCAYHGWSFDGATGACVDIPNLSSDEKVSPRYRVNTFRVCERDGFVFVAFSDEVDVEQCLSAKTDAGTGYYQTFGNSIVSMPATEYAAALLDGPETLLQLRGVGVSDFFLGDPVYRDGWLVSDREASWSYRSQPPSIKEVARPLILRVEVERHQCAARVWLLNADQEPLALVILGFSAGLRSTSTVCWRYHQFPAWRHNAPQWLRLSLNLGLPAINVYEAISGHALARLLRGPSKHIDSNVIDEYEQLTGEL